jgi:hypothetical protein
MKTTRRGSARSPKRRTSSRRSSSCSARGMRTHGRGSTSTTRALRRVPRSGFETPNVCLLPRWPTLR